MTEQAADSCQNSHDWYAECLQLTFPPVMVKLLQALAQPEPDFSVIAELLAMDPVLAASILELVNSPYYGQRTPISDMQRAVVVLGSREILKIALSISYQQRVSKAIHRKPAELFPDWRMALWSAISSEQLAKKLAPGDEALAYLAALLKDLGIFIKLCAHNADPVLARRHMFTEYTTTHATSEQVHWGESHQQLSAELFHSWHMPDRFVEAIREHHNSALANGMQPFSLCVALSTRWAELLQTGTGDPAELIRHEMLIMGLLQFDKQSMEELRNECGNRFKAMLTSLDIEDAPLSDRLYSQSLESIQRYHFLSIELQQAESPMEAARMLGRQLHWLWDIDKWEVALSNPGQNDYSLFRPVKGEGVREMAREESIESLPWGTGGAKIQLAAEGKLFGRLNLPRKKVAEHGENGLSVYSNFLAKALEFFYNEQTQLRSKARLFDSLPNMVAQVDSKGIIHEGNTAFLTMNGLKEDPRGHSLRDVLLQSHGLDVVPLWRKFAADIGHPATNQLFTYAHNGDRLRTCALITLFRNMPEQNSIMVRIEDVSEVTTLEAEVLEQNNFLSSLLTAMQEIVFTIDRRGCVLWTSSDLLLRTGSMLFNSAQPTSPDAQWGPDHLPETSEAMPLEVAITLSDDSSVLYELAISPLQPRVGGERWIVVGRDLTIIRRMEEKVRMQAIFDGLTGLFNHTHFHMLLDREIARCKRTSKNLGLIFIDLDGFKLINDTKGHREGDKILRQVSEALRACIRKGTDFACRYGGDEFTVILTEFAGDVLPMLAERLKNAVEIHTSNAVGASLGATVLHPHDTLESIVHRADKASYTAKKAGGRQVFIATRDT
ncbi:HDOD domain-containing protein [Oleidesulfovibrio sp.]|uniref:HDOD domain-containing protein n=1 Tax=Oleidesulfovibrio sp. TaxID=2909707 RepID=UPI003A85D562